MLRLEIPNQVFEDAVALAMKREVKGDIGLVVNEVSRLLSL